MPSKLSFDDIRWEFRHLIWTFILPRMSKPSNQYPDEEEIDVIEATDQYGIWYHAISIRRDAISYPDRFRQMLLCLDKIRMGKPVQVKMNVLGGIWEGKYKR